MKTKSLLLLLALSAGSIMSQPTNFPAFVLTSLDGDRISSTELLQNERATVIIFWKSGSTNCCDNLDNMQTAWLDQLKEQNVRFIAICTDCNGDWSHLKPLVYGKDWEFEVYVDKNGDCRRAMAVTTVPYTILFDGNQQLVCTYAGYCKGNEDLLCDKIMHLLNADNSELISKSK